MRIGKTGKSWDLFYNKLFYKDLQNDNHFFFNRSFCSQNICFASSLAAQFDIRMKQEISKRETENGKCPGLANYNI